MKASPARYLRGIGLLVGFVAWAHVDAFVPNALAQGEMPGLEAVLDELRGGGFVIYLRHAATDEGGPNDEDADLERCEAQRNLNDIGREQAKLIGQSIVALGVPIGDVLSSPYCRCKDTASLAFGRFSVDPDLAFIIMAHPDDAQRMTEALRRMLATPPDAGTNTVIVSHTGNLREAADIWPKPEGVAFVFRPREDATFEAIARVPPEAWPTLAGVDPAGEP